MRPHHVQGVQHVEDCRCLDCQILDVAPAGWSEPERVITAQDSETPGVLVTYEDLTGRRTTERVSVYLAAVLRDAGLTL